MLMKRNWCGSPGDSLNDLQPATLPETGRASRWAQEMGTERGWGDELRERALACMSKIAFDEDAHG